MHIEGRKKSARNNWHLARFTTPLGRRVDRRLAVGKTIVVIVMLTTRGIENLPHWRTEKIRLPRVYRCNPNRQTQRPQGYCPK